MTIVSDKLQNSRLNKPHWRYLENTAKTLCSFLADGSLIPLHVGYMLLRHTKLFRELFLCKTSQIAVKTEIASGGFFRYLFLEPVEIINIDPSFIILHTDLPLHLEPIIEWA